MVLRTCPRTLRPQPDQESERAEREGNEETGEETSLEKAYCTPCVPITPSWARNEQHLSCLKPDVFMGVQLREPGNVHPGVGRETGKTGA